MIDDSYKAFLDVQLYGAQCVRPEKSRRTPRPNALDTAALRKGIHGFRGSEPSYIEQVVGCWTALHEFGEVSRWKI